MKMSTKIKEYIDKLFSFYDGYGISQKDFYEIVLNIVSQMNDEYIFSVFKREIYSSAQEDRIRFVQQG